MATDLDQILPGDAGGTPPADAHPSPKVLRDEAPPPVEVATAKLEAVDDGDGGGQGMVPHAALHAEKQKVKRYTEQVASFERELSEQRRMVAAMLEAQQRQQQPQQPPPDWYQDPNGAAAHVMQAQLQARVDPFQQAVAAQLRAQSKQIAMSMYKDEVKEAE